MKFCGVKKKITYLFCNCLGAPIFRQKIGIFVYVEAIFLKRSTAT